MIRIGYQDDLNVHQYALNDPIQNSDASGHEVQRREITLNLGVVTFSRGGYSASEAGEPFDARMPWARSGGNAVETGEYWSWGFIVGFSVGIELGQFSCRDCGPEDIAGNSATYGGDLIGGGSYGRNESGGRSYPGVGEIREYEGPETFGFSLGPSRGAGLTLSDTYVTERRSTALGLQRRAELALGDGADVRSNEDGSVTVTRPGEGSRIPDRSICRRENDQVVCN